VAAARVNEQVQLNQPGLVAAEAVTSRKPVVLIWARRFQRWFFLALVYLLLIDIAFAFLLPVIYMASTSLMTVQDFLDPGVYWIPRQVYWDNIVLAFQSMNYLVGLKNSATIVFFGTLGQIISCSLAGYGFARYRFPGRDFLFMMVLFTFIVPPQTIIVPLFILYRELGWIDTFLPFTVPAFLSHGLRGSLLVLIFRQFFMRQPYELEEAAYIDGCSPWRTYAQIMLPLARPALLVVFLFSLVWHWNDYYEPTMYLMKPQNFTVPLRLRILQQGLQEITGGQAGELFNEPLMMAACFLVVLPPLILYLMTQRFFVESIERTGLVD